MSGVFLYTKERCVQCDATKRWLDAKGVEFTPMYAPDHLDYLRDLCASQAPVLVSGESIITGFQPNKLKELFG